MQYHHDMNCNPWEIKRIEGNKVIGSSTDFHRLTKKNKGHNMVQRYC